MIKFENPNGYIEITNNYFEKLVGQVAQSCFGVTGMVNNFNPMQSIKQIIMNKSDRDNYNQGVVVKSVNGSLVIDLHISVSYVVNINAIANAIRVGTINTGQYFFNVFCMIPLLIFYFLN